MSAVQIGGLTPFTTIDYPGKLAAVVFFVGCPFRCKYCSNRILLKSREGEYDPDKIIEWLKDRAKKLEAVVFSGGEALFQGDAAIEYMRRVGEMGFSIGLHTNGFYPAALRNALEIVDWVGLDFKASRKNYPKLTGVDNSYEKMAESLDIWLASGVDGEVRITCDPRFVSVDDLIEIAGFAAARGCKKFAVQKYVPHFEDNMTTESDRGRFFSDPVLKNKIGRLFDSVIWRE
jgi:pyruvate formate lyase activating enzyme